MVIVKSTDYHKIYQSLSDLEQIYHNIFKKWFYSKVVKNHRDIYVVIDQDKYIAVMILKNDHIESKICTLWVDSEYRNCGIGTQLIKKAINVLDCKKPKMSVNKVAYDTFKPLINKFGFDITSYTEGNYYIN